MSARLWRTPSVTWPREAAAHTYDTARVCVAPASEMYLCGCASRRYSGPRYTHASSGACGSAAGRPSGCMSARLWRTPSVTWPREAAAHTYDTARVCVAPASEMYLCGCASRRYSGPRYTHASSGACGSAAGRPSGCMSARLWRTPSVTWPREAAAHTYDTARVCVAPASEMYLCGCASRRYSGPRYTHASSGACGSAAGRPSGCMSARLWRTAQRHVAARGGGAHVRHGARVRGARQRDVFVWVCLEAV
ncbi:unnamed protein product [Arctia plantaginis]|uniref:Uncharacterized protein n=1 Tax=Arctia plantaginis TaxID=874455 RepID=A0A8S1ADG3_ARCPL|nr:unnamed protein product [Arctia plantaginis]